MKKRLIPLFISLLVTVFAACSIEKTDKAFGYTYEEYNKMISSNLGIDEKVLAVSKYEYDNQKYYLLEFIDDFKGGTEKTNYYRIDSDYIEKHRSDDTGPETSYFGYEKPKEDKIIESYTVTKDEKFEKASRG